LRHLPRHSSSLIRDQPGVLAGAAHLVATEWAHHELGYQTPARDQLGVLGREPVAHIRQELTTDPPVQLRHGQSSAVERRSEDLHVRGQLVPDGLSGANVVALFQGNDATYLDGFAAFVLCDFLDDGGVAQPWSGTAAGEFAV
jgi:hypothetical protein